MSELITTLLSIDDDPGFRRSLRAYFEDSGLRVLEAGDGMTGIQICQSERVDVVLVDLTMPGMNGMEVVKRLSLDHPELPLIIVSGTAELDDAVEAVHRGVWDFVTKPIISMAALDHTIQGCLEKARLRRQNEDYRLHLERLVEARTEEIERTRLKIIQRLGRAGEFRDNETGTHVIRMSYYARMLALSAELPLADAQLLLQAAPMHDIGKIGIPDAVLLKPGKLDPDERALMQTHVRIGADIIGDDPSELMRMARVVVLTHHEKWDGSGYPQGLAGEAIPLVGRIVAIADVFDALMSERPYKRAWPEQEAVDYIRDQAGRHFDPRLVPIFLDLLPEVRIVQAQYRD